MSCIYKIQNLDKGLCYIGSCKDFVKRMAVHKTLSKSDDRKLYKLIRENDGWDSFQKEVMCKTDNITKNERILLERQYKELYLDNMSTYEYKGDEKRLIYAKSYYDKNKDKILLRMKNKRQSDKNDIHAKIINRDGIQVTYEELKHIGEHIVDDEVADRLPYF